MKGYKDTTKTQYFKGGDAHGTKGAAKISKVMGEFKSGALHSGSKKGPEVTNPKQAVAIALSEARKAGAKVPMKKAEGGRIERQDAYLGDYARDGMNDAQRYRGLKGRSPIEGMSDKDYNASIERNAKAMDTEFRASTNKVRPGGPKKVTSGDILSAMDARRAYAKGGPVKRTKAVPVAPKGPMIGAKKQMGGMASSIRTNPDLNKQDRRFVEDRASQMRAVVGKPMKKGGMSC